MPSGKEIALIAGGIASTGVAVGMPISSLYTSGQENRGFINSAAHLAGATVVGGALGAGISIGTSALTGMDIAKMIAKGM